MHIFYNCNSFLHRFDVANWKDLEDQDVAAIFWPKPNGWKDRRSEPSFDKATKVQHTQQDMSFHNEIYSEEEVKQYLELQKEEYRLQKQRQSGQNCLRMEVNNMIAFKAFNSLHEAKQECEHNEVTWGIGKVMLLNILPLHFFSFFLLHFSNTPIAIFHLRF